MISKNRLSQVVRNIPASGIRRFFDLANEMKGEIISLSIGEPDFVTPWSVTEAGIYSLERGKTHYSPNAGYLELRQAIAKYMDRLYQVQYDPKSEVICTVGGSEALDILIRGLVNPGEEVLIPEPCFVAYRACTLLAGAIPVSIPLEQEEGFKLTPEKLKKYITPRTRAIVLGFPSNPTGATMSYEELKTLVPIFEDHPEISIITDELYVELDYSNNKPASLIQFESLWDRTFYVGGFSKSLAMTGWRIGYLCGPKEYVSEIIKIHQYIIMSAPSTAQHAALAALQNGGSEIEKMRKEYNKRRLVIIHALEEMGLPHYKPEGAFYMFPDIRSTGLDSTAFAEEFLKEERVAIVPGSAFGDAGNGFVRISYASSMENIKEAMKRLHRFVDRRRS